MPALLKVNEYDPPLLSSSDLKVLSPAVTLCWTESSNFQVTFVPVLTVRSPGLNEKFCTVTVAGPPEAVELPPVGAELLEQPVAAVRRMAARSCHECSHGISPLSR